MSKLTKQDIDVLNKVLKKRKSKYSWSELTKGNKEGFVKFIKEATIASRLAERKRNKKVKK